MIEEYLSDLEYRFLPIQYCMDDLGIDAPCWAKKGYMGFNIGSHQFTRGICQRSPGELRVDLSGDYETFKCAVGLQPESPSNAEIVFQVFVDGQERFSSGKMTAKDAPRAVFVDVMGAMELRIVTAMPAGAQWGYGCWANARLIKTADIECDPPHDCLEISPFAKVFTSEPQRVEGTRARRCEEFPPEDIFPIIELAPDANGIYAVGSRSSRRGVGLAWNERRRISMVGIEFEDAPPAKISGIELEYWDGVSAWQGLWTPLPYKMERNSNRLLFNVDWRSQPGLWRGTMKIRWNFPASRKPVLIRRLFAWTISRCTTTDVWLQLDRLVSDSTASVEIYNGYAANAPTPGSRLVEWNLGEPLHLRVTHVQSCPFKLDRAVLRVHLPDGSCAVALDDVISEHTLYVPALGLIVSSIRNWGPLQEPDSETVLQQVRRLPDQTFDGALAKTHNPHQDSGPIMLSLACNNSKFVVDRDGTVKYNCFEIKPKFGTCLKIEQHLEGGYLPIPVTTAQTNKIRYSQTVLTTVTGNFDSGSSETIDEQLPLCLVEYRINSLSDPHGTIQFKLDLLANDEYHTLPKLRKVDRGLLAEDGGRLLAFVDLSEAKSLSAKASRGTVSFSGSISDSEEARIRVYIPGWSAPAGKAPNDLPTVSDAVHRLRDYWQSVLAEAMQVDLPDARLMNIYRASQVHCLLAARRDENTGLAIPWVTPLTHGPLDTEAQHVTSGMDAIGHHKFAREALEFFESKYSPQGFITTGYTLVGTGLYLRALAQHYHLTGDREWLARVAPKMISMCNWIAQQRKKTKKTSATGSQVPEYGLMPPGVLADRNVYSYYFYLNAIYYAGLQATATALADIHSSRCESILEEANAFREDILRAYRLTQSRTPVAKLRNGRWVAGYPAEVYCYGSIQDFSPREEDSRVMSYDVEVGSHHLINLGIIPPDSQDANNILEHMEDVQFLRHGWHDYPDTENQKDWFNLGGFSKVQPFCTSAIEAYALRDDVKPFIRSYFNTLASVLNTEMLWLWEHFNAFGAWNKTEATGRFLRQTRLMLVMERGDELWLAPFVTNNWLHDGMSVAVSNAPTRFGRVSYRIVSHVNDDYIEAVVESPVRVQPSRLVIRFRHPQDAPMKRVIINGQPSVDFDPEKECIILEPGRGLISVRAEY